MTDTNITGRLAEKLAQKTAETVERRVSGMGGSMWASPGQGEGAGWNKDTYGGAEHTPRHSPQAPSQPEDGGSDGRGAASSRIARWTNPLETIDLCDQHALHEFCEVGRGFSRYLAVITQLAATELEEGVKQMVRGQGNVALLGFDMRLKVRRATKHLSGAGDAFESAAGQFVAAYMAFEREFADVMEALNSKPRQSQEGFRIR